MIYNSWLLSTAVEAFLIFFEQPAVEALTLQPFQLLTPLNLHKSRTLVH
jgi:hypothetical protein